MTASTAWIGHQIAVRLASELIREGLAAGLDWKDIAVATETVVAVTVCACASLSRTPNQAAFVRETIEMVTAQAHHRAMVTVTGAPQS